ncbi:MAG: hypothetical protein CMJ06_04150 [Pelagibacterales bacterium]|nr:hypothetical protein [Pelagibacterales bacterium]OUU62043.1 MAG: hypothetical protein CBC22_05600 [Alphaproteobacteria bacterium TMED62]|tara:strand:- start:4504 stop:5895 length:1392 start_codon:yes stop_codon:yes gene_type:complete
MSILWNSSLLKELVDAQSTKEWQASGVEIDSRKIKKGDLFCALNGANHNGHDYINSAAKKGAIACLISENLKNNNKIAFAKVDNVLDALDKMAKDVRKRSHAKFIAVTGSVGKTGTKDMIQLALSKIANTYSNESSYNNYLGVPLSLARLPENTKYCILELGMNKKGEIRDLSRLVMPEVAILTAIEEAHLGGLKSLKNIADAKSEILENLDVNGCLIINIDTNFSKYIIKKAKKLGIKNIITYGKSKSSNVRLVSHSLNENKYFVQAQCFGIKLSWFMPAVGEHWIYNSLSILALSSYLKINIKKILKGLFFFKVPSGRGNNIYLKYKNQSFLIIDDSYNSNPASLIASLINFSKLKNAGRKILVLGDMMELGENSTQIHKDFGVKIKNFGFNILFTVGKNMHELYKVTKNIENRYHDDNLNNISKKILKDLEDGDAILFKGSNSINLKKVIHNIKKECEEI